MFTERAQAVVERAKDHAFSRDQAEIDLAAVIFAVAHAGQGSLVLADCLASSDEALQQGIPAPQDLLACPGRLPVSVPAHHLLTSARELAQEFPDRHQPGLVDVRHLAAALALSPEACALLRVGPAGREGVTRRLAALPADRGAAAVLSDLTELLRRVQTDLLARVFGQDHAVRAFVEGLFHAEVVAAADTTRRAPRAVFVFAGPPGVGKTFMAELGASCLARPFLRLDMGGFPGRHPVDDLVGTARPRQDARPGQLTAFVDQHPDAVLLFDEIEKAHPDLIRLLLEILDAGALEDRFTERPVRFRDTTLVLTTHVGRALYERPNESGIHTAHAGFHRRTILDALESEKDARSGESLFPPALCSRMAAGTPVLFHHLRVGDLVRVVRAEMTRVAGLLLRQTGKRVSFDSQVPLAVLLREGARVDARTLRARAEAFVKTELHGFCRLFKADCLEDVLDPVDEIRFQVEGPVEDMGAELAQLLRPQGPFSVLLVAPPDTCDLCREALPEFDWQCASDADDALGCLSRRDVDVVMVDLMLGIAQRRLADTSRGVDSVPSAARSLAAGQEVLRRLHERVPSAPIYLLACRKREEAPEAGASLDDELLTACIRGGGARGMVATSLAPPLGVGSKAARDRLAADLREICARLVQERVVLLLGQQRRVLAFETSPRVVNGVVEVCLRGLRLARALASADASEVLEDVERPSIRFDDCIGLDAAKADLALCVDHMRHPGRFAALGLEAPRGLLLHGPAGTGKTTLARAMAGESDVALVRASASRFLAAGPGSGPQGVRDLFARARRHAPAIVFIDDIDAVGKIRTRGAGGGRAEQDVLDALLVELDAFGTPSTDRPMFVLAATSLPMDGEEGGDGEATKRLDPGLLSRFSRTVLVDLPHRAAREQYLQLRLAGRPHCTITPELVSLIAERSPGLTIANLEAVIGAAVRAASQGDGALTDALLEHAFEGSRLGEARVRSQEEVIRTACHEAGHTLMYWLAGWWPAYVTVVSSGGHGGHMARCSEESDHQGGRTRPQLLADIRVSLGGRAAELVYYGVDDGLSTGAAGDLARATRLARAMVCRFGMVEEYGVLATPELQQVEAAVGSPMYQQVNFEAAKILKNQMAETAHLMRMYQERLDAVAQALAHRERLTREDLQAILGPRYANGNELRGDVGR